MFYSGRLAKKVTHGNHRHSLTWLLYLPFLLSSTLTNTIGPLVSLDRLASYPGLFLSLPDLQKANKNLFIQLIKGFGLDHLGGTPKCCPVTYWKECWQVEVPG